MKQIPLTQGKFALVDNEDFEWLNQFKWCYDHGYAKRGIKIKNTKNTKTIFMHRLILNPPPDKFTDHIDRNKLNNQRNNLRICTQTENNQNNPKQKTNTSGYKGITWEKQRKKWIAQIRHKNKRLKIGRFNTKEEAALAYNKAAAKLHGKFANINIIKPTT